MTLEFPTPALPAFSALLLPVLLSGCMRGGEPDPAENPARPLFQNVTERSGLQRSVAVRDPLKLWIVDNIGSGAAFLDGDGDGLLDIYLPSGARFHQGKTVPARGPAYYRQIKPGRFEERTEDVGLVTRDCGVGAAVGDIDNDGDPDLLVTCVGKNRLFLNTGGRFTDVSARFGLTQSAFSTSAVFFDYDRDGFLDLYVANYVVFDPHDLPNDGRPCLHRDVEISCGPEYFTPQPDQLLRSIGGSRFEDVTVAAGMHRREGAYGLGVAAADFNGDGRPDVYVANDTTPNFLWLQRAGGTFAEQGLLAGVALSEAGQGQAGMGVDVGDADGDGRLDLFVTNYAEEYYSYYRHLGSAAPDAAAYEDASHAAGLAAPSYPTLGWGVKWADFDGDGDLDLATANGHVYPQATSLQPPGDYLQACSLYVNDGAGHFKERSTLLGDAFDTPRSYRGLTVGDYDNDGDPDVLLTAMDSAPILLKNTSASVKWLTIRLTGTRSNRDGAGAQLSIVAPGGKRHVRNVSRGGSYLSAHDPRVRFALPSTGEVTVRVRWPSGRSEEFGPLSAPGFVTLTEGKGRVLQSLRVR